MGALDYLRRIGTPQDEPIVDLTPIDLAWIEQRVSTTLASNDITFTVDNGFVEVTTSSGPSPALISLAPLAEKLLQLDRTRWSDFIWEWCANSIDGVPSRLDVGAEVVEMLPGNRSGGSLASVLGVSTGPDDGAGSSDVHPTSTPPTPLDSVPDSPPVPVDDGIIDLREENHARRPTGDVADAEDAPSPSTEHTDGAGQAPAPAPSIDLADAIGRLSLRMVSVDDARTVHTDLVIPTSIPGLSAALAVGPDEWVDTDLLDAWGITLDMALSMAENRLRDLAPDVTIVFLDERTPVHVVETQGPDAPGLLPYIDDHVAIRDPHDSEVLVAVATDSLLFVQVNARPHGTDDADDVDEAAHLTPSTGASLLALIDCVVAEASMAPGLASPAIYQWSPDAPPVVVASGLETASGRLAARSWATRHAAVAT